MKKYKITIRNSKYGGYEAELAVHAFWFVWWHVRTVRRDVPLFIKRCKVKYPDLVVVDRTKV